MILELIKGDITEIKVDAIVNAANSSLLDGSGVDGAIHKIGGKELLEDCIKIRNKQGGCKVGQAVMTRAGNLPANFVIHTVGPVWTGGNNKEKELLQSAYINSLETAFRNDIKTISFPNISTGRYGFPKKEAAPIAINSIIEYSNSDFFKKIIFVCFDHENYLIYKNLLHTHL